MAGILRRAGGRSDPRVGQCSTFYTSPQTRDCHTRPMRARRALQAGFVAFGVALLLPLHAAAATPQVERVDLVGDINNIMSAYITGAVDRAQADHADALLVVMNTPGGISTSMDDIVTSLLNSKVPVIVYVYPSGARAASAGLFVAEAADILAMAPGTNIGSAHPIDASGANLTGDLGTKVLNDAVTRVRNLAAMHGRNADWAEQAVRNSVNINAEDAVKLHVADLEIADPAALMNAVDGRTLPRVGGALVLHTAGAAIEDYPMPYWQEFLNALIDPTIAALLILVAAYGIITELTSPGAILPGVVGGIAGILAIVSLANLPVNIAGGLLSLILGMAFLINTGPVGLGVDPIVIFGSAAISFAFFVFFVDRILRSRRRRVFTGVDALVGSVGEAREELSPEGLVFVRGALWKAVAQGGPIPVSSPVQVVGRNGLRLDVVASSAELVKE